MNSLPTVLIKPGEADRVLSGHPWIYEGAVLRVTAEPKDGDVVQVKDHRQRFLGVGFWNAKSRIRVRVLNPERVEINQDFFEQRILEALAIRQKHLPRATSFRVVNAESDSLSGLIVDKYEDVLALQISSLGMDRRKTEIVAALQKIFSPRAIVERSDVGSRKFEGLEESRGVLAGELPPGEFTVNLNGLSFATDLIAGHKTGLYLDQQMNYARVAEFCAGANVLDCFTFLGGFALHAARAGAAHVHGVDQSADALAAAQRNAATNGVAENCSFDTANVFDWLKAQTAVAPHEKIIPRYDVIVLDPPSFTRTRAAVEDALRGYKEIHLRALKLLKRGGTLATFCCSHHVDANLFQNVILSAAFDARKMLRRVATYSQSPDHPVIPSIPETEYLKGFAFELVR
ncbi:MAG TPA: class I SAM-dependent rRNA methyltransferase [Verrucomicrobiae bacterium]|jgi:23S rRNA (cytosine1962-C5)-methyltransferase